MRIERVWLVSELYYPEETSTGYLLTRIAEGLASHGEVAVLCSQPTYSARGLLAPPSERLRGVQVHRCSGTRLNKDFLLLRVINILTISAFLLFRAIRHFRPGDLAIVVTNPPLLPFLIRLACRMRRVPCILLVHDVYPDALEAAGILRPGGVFARFLSWLYESLYRGFLRIIVLGRDMHARLLRKLNNDSTRLVVIPNWADLGDVVPRPREGNELLKETGLSEKFVVQYAGNMGRTHGLEDLLDAAALLRLRSEVHFLFIGSGARQSWLQKSIRDRELRNVRLMASRPRSDQCNFLNGCDVAVVSFVPGMAGISVPSRMYNILAAGKPIIAVTDSDSELAAVVKEGEVGWIVPPRCPEKLVEAILDAADHPDLRGEMGIRARSLVEKTYSLDRVIGSYQSMFLEIEQGSEGSKVSDQDSLHPNCARIG